MGRRWRRKHLVILAAVCLVVVALAAILIGWRRSLPPEVAVTQVVAEARDGLIGRIVVETPWRSRVEYHDETTRPVAVHTSMATDLYTHLLQGGVAPEQMPRIEIEPPGWWTRAGGRLFVVLFLAIVLSGGLLLTAIALLADRVDTPTTTAVKEMERLTREGWHWGAPSFTMQDLAGLSGQVERQIDEIRRMVREPKVFRRLGARLPKGVMLIGPSGVGKTTLAHALAAELGFGAMCTVQGASLLGPFVGLGPRRLQEIFKQVREKGRCVLFFDEFDALATQRRSNAVGGMEPERHLLLAHLQVGLDALVSTPVLVVAATNRPELLDPALLRMGRFDRQIHLDLPDPEARGEILALHARDKPLESVDLEAVARGLEAGGTAGFSGADLAEAMNEAAIIAGHEHSASRPVTTVRREHVAEALQRVRSLILHRNVSGREESFGRAVAGFQDPGAGTTTFADVGGLAEERRKLELVIDFLRRPEPYLAVGCRMPRGVLMSGPPGVGKTLLARAVAGEAGVPFFFASGSAFAEMYVGVAAARVRDLFRLARQQSPALVFLDEIDALASKRAGSARGDAVEHGHALNQLLAEMDGFQNGHSVVVVGATNRPDVLDQALLRRGRFDLQIDIGLPDEETREEILRTYLRDEDGLAADQLQTLIERTRDKSGAELEWLVNRARIESVRLGGSGSVEWDHLDLALKEQERTAKDAHVRTPW